MNNEKAINSKIAYNILTVWFYWLFMYFWFDKNISNDPLYIYQGVNRYNFKLKLYFFL